MIRRPRRLHRRLLAVGLLLGSAAGAAYVASNDRVAHLALPTLEAPATTTPTATHLRAGAACEVTPLANLRTRISALTETADGTLWIGTFDRGLWALSAAGKTPIRITGLTGRALFVNALAPAEGGGVLAATNGGLHLIASVRDRARRLDETAAEALAVPSQRERPTAADARSSHHSPATMNRTSYVGTSRGLRIVEHGAVTIPASPKLRELRITALAINAGRLWIGSPRGVWSVPLDAVDGPPEWHPLVFGPQAASTNAVLALAPSADGVIAATDDGGLVFVREGHDPVASRFDRPNANLGNPGAAASWGERAVLGTQGGGLLFASVDRDGAFTTVASDDLSVREVSALSTGRRLFAGTAGGEVLALDCGPK